MFLQPTLTNQAPLLDSSQLSPQQKMALALMQQNAQQQPLASQNPQGQASSAAGISQLGNTLLGAAMKMGGMGAGGAGGGQ